MLEYLAEKQDILFSLFSLNLILNIHFCFNFPRAAGCAPELQVDRRASRPPRTWWSWPGTRSLPPSPRPTPTSASSGHTLNITRIILIYRDLEHKQELFLISKDIINFFLRKRTRKITTHMTLIENINLHMFFSASDTTVPTAELWRDLRLDKTFISHSTLATLGQTGGKPSTPGSTRLTLSQFRAWAATSSATRRVTTARWCGAPPRGSGVGPSPTSEPQYCTRVHQTD